MGNRSSKGKDAAASATGGIGTVAAPEDKKKETQVSGNDSTMGFGSAFIEWFPCVMYVILYVVLDVLIASEGHTNPATGKRQYNYTPAVLVLLGEFGKLIITTVLLLLGVGLKKKDDQGKETEQQLREGKPHSRALPEPGPKLLDWRLGIYYVVPAVLYTSWNVINYISLLYVSLSIYSIIYQSVLFFSAFLWSVTFKKKLSLMQWFALLLLAAGVFVVHLKIPFKIHFQLAALWVLLQAFISAVASVYNEFLYKRPEEKDSSINQQNCYLYVFTSICTFFYLLGTQGPLIFTVEQFFRGFTPRVVLIVFVSMALGLSVSLILKHRNVIVKLYAQAIHSPLEVIAAHIFLHTELTAMIIVASLLIAVSTWLYYRPPSPPSSSKPPADLPKQLDSSEPSSAPMEGPSSSPSDVAAASAPLEESRGATSIRNDELGAEEEQTRAKKDNSMV